MLNAETIISDDLSPSQFSDLCLEIFRYQFSQNPIYRSWLTNLSVHPDQVKAIEDIPFLPIELFKRHSVLCGGSSAQDIVFTSSGTSGSVVSRHIVKDISLYQKSFTRGFERVYGQADDYCILALLPSYLERKDSSLVFMFDELIRQSRHPYSGFFLNDTADLLRKLKALNSGAQKVILLGVSYALLDLCEEGLKLGPNIIVMETGGMKGKRKEMLKEELHQVLKKGLGTEQVHSEYGMTELLSQAYSTGSSQFVSPPWMKFLIREVEDPLSIRKDLKGGGINVIDLANLHSCSFIATQDLGRLNEKGELELLGRFDNSDTRGCNLMYSREY